jgi:hypothetical protein
MKRSLLIEKRKKARELKKRGWSNQKIARYLVAHRDSVKRWLEMDEYEIESDSRGWRKGKSKKYGQVVKARIIAIRRQLERQPGVSTAAKTVRLLYKKKYRSEIPEWFIYQTMREQREKVHMGPPDSDFQYKRLKRVARVMMGIEFLGKKKLQPEAEQALFLSCKYFYPKKIGITSWIDSQTGEEVLRVLSYIWHHFRKPDLLKMGYHPVFGASPSQPACIGKFTVNLLNSGIIPFYSPLPDDGVNIDLDPLANVFSEPFCRNLRIAGSNVDEMKIDNFYLEYRRRGGGDHRQLKIKDPDFRSAFAGVDLENRRVDRFLQNKILFRVKVENKAVIRILATEIDVDSCWLGFWLLCQLDMRRKQLSIYYEDEAGEFTLLKKLDFWIKNVKYS